jgi:MYXO-CTERM domain-containing protein
MKLITRGLCYSAFLWAACEPNITSQQQEILGGDTTSVGAFPTVVAVVDDFGGLCTGTLIAPRVVLTAAHCVDPALFGANFDDAKVARFTNIVLDDTDAFESVFGNGPGLVVQVVKTVENPLFNLNRLGDDDVGLIFLETPILDRVPSPVDQDLNRNLVGTTVTQVGYGISDQNPDAGTEIVLRDKLIDDCAALQIGDNSDLVCYDQRDGSGKCDGDSGGPSFDAQGKIVGITSFGDIDCVDFGADTRTAGQSELAFIKATIDANADIACGADGFDFDLCSLDADVDPVDDDGFCGGGRKHKDDNDCARLGCSASVAQESSSSPLILLSFFVVGLSLLRRRRS